MKPQWLADYESGLAYVESHPLRIHVCMILDLEKDYVSYHPATFILSGHKGKPGFAVRLLHEGMENSDYARHKLENALNSLVVYIGEHGGEL